MKITKARLKQIIKEEIFKEQIAEENIEKEIKGQLLDKMSRGPIDTRTLIDQVAAYFKKSVDLYGDVSEEDIEALLQDPSFNKYKENDNYHASDEIKKAYILKHIKENPGTSLKDALPELDGDELAGIIDSLSREGKIGNKGASYSLKESIKQIVKEHLLKEYEYFKLNEYEDDLDDIIFDLTQDLKNKILAPGSGETQERISKLILKFNEPEIIRGGAAEQIGEHLAKLFVQLNNDISPELSKAINKNGFDTDKLKQKAALDL